MPGSTARATWTCAWTLTAQERSQAVSGASIPPRAMMPALEQNRSIRPNVLSACLTSASTSAAEDMSAVTARARCPPASIPAATCAAPAPSRSATTTPAASCAARARASARPMPLAPPLTTATEPAGRMSAPPRLSGPVGPGGQVRVGGDLLRELLPGLLALGGQVLGRPGALVRVVALEHVAGHGDLVHFVDPVGDRHRRRGGVHRLQRGQVGGAQRAHDVQGAVADVAQDLGAGVLARGDLGAGF